MIIYNYRYNYRSKIEILHAILEYIDKEGTARKTHILYATNLNTRSIEKYLSYLIRIKAIEKVKNDGIKYKLTPYGHHVLCSIRKLEKLFESEEDPSSKVINEKADSIKLFVGERIHSLQREHIRGKSGLYHELNIADGKNKKYFVKVLSGIIDSYDLIDELGRRLLPLIDTDLHGIMILDNDSVGSIGYIRSILSLSKISEDKYFIVY